MEPPDTGYRGLLHLHRLGPSMGQVYSLLIRPHTSQLPVPDSTGQGNLATFSQKSNISVAIEVHQVFVTGSSEMPVTQPPRLEIQHAFTQSVTRISWQQGPEFGSSAFPSSSARVGKILMFFLFQQMAQMCNLEILAESSSFILLTVSQTTWSQHSLDISAMFWPIILFLFWKYRSHWREFH